MSVKHIVIDARIRPSSTGRYADRLLEYLQKLDTENHYTVLLRPGDDWQPTAKNFSTQVCTYRRFSFNVFSQLTFSRFLRQLKPDLVHFTMSPIEPVLYFGKRVTTTHDLTMFRFNRPAGLALWIHRIRMVGYRFLFWASQRLAQRIFVPTQFVADDLARHYPFTKAKTVVTHEASEPVIVAEAEPLLDAGEEFIFHVGSPFPHKNIDRLVAAFERLTPRHPELRLVLAGKLEKYFEELLDGIADSPVRDRIIVPGYITDGQLRWLYQNARAYVLPSLSEGFGLPGIEAMAHGCPLISSNTTCLPEVYQDGALYFDPADVGDIADKIEQLLTDPALAKSLSARGRQVIKRYSWEKMASQTLAVYEEVLA